MDSQQSEYPLKPQTVFLLVMSIVWLVDPLVIGAMANGAGNGFVIIGAPVTASLVAAPVLAGIYCASARPPVMQCTLVVVGSGGPMVVSVVGAMFLVEPMATASGELVEVAAVTGSFSILMAMVTWGMASVFWTYGLRRAKMSIKGMVVGTVATALSICLIQWVWSFLGMQFTTAFLLDELLPFAILMFIVSVLLVTLYRRRIEIDMLGLGVILLPTVVVIAALTGGIGTSEPALFVCFFVLALYGILRLGIEMEVVPWRPLATAPSTATPVVSDDRPTGADGQTSEDSVAP